MSAPDLCSLLGISAQLDWLLAGHSRFVLLALGLYALTYAVGLLAEVSYAFDRFGFGALILSPVIFLWVLLTSMAALTVCWRLAASGRSSAVVWAGAGFVISATVLCAGLFFFLPNVPITETFGQAHTASAAYLKGVMYTIPLVFTHLLFPFHFVVAMQRELALGHYRTSLAFLSGDRRAVSPRGAVYLSVRTLGIILSLTFLASIVLTLGLFNQVKPSQYLNQFMVFIQVRWVSYFLLWAICLWWYSRSLNELKRECAAAERVEF